MIFLRLFLAFAKIGFIGFGGGLAILPLIYQSALMFGEMSASEFANLFAISQATPGPIAVNAATFVGFQIAGVGGAAAATAGVAIPSFILVAIVANFLDRHRESRLIQGAFAGIRPATVGMIASAVIFIGETALFREDAAAFTGLAQFAAELNVIPALMALATVWLMAKTKIGTIRIILIMGVLGALLCS